MQQDACLRAGTRAIYEHVYPTEDWAPVPFDEAERRRTVHYRQAVCAAYAARATFAAPGEQLPPSLTA